MAILITGLAVFFLTHLIPAAVPVRQALIERFSLNGYKGLFSLLSLVGLVLIVIGKASAPFEAVYNPPAWGRHLAMLLVLAGFILLPAAYMPTNIKRLTPHPMMWGVFLWAVGHLLANGDLASLLLFGGFALYAPIHIISANARGAQKQTEKMPLKKDAIVIVAGLVAYGVLFGLHPWLFGYALI